VNLIHSQSPSKSGQHRIVYLRFKRKLSRRTTIERGPFFFNITTFVP
jgi:hypothetical protein